MTTASALRRRLPAVAFAAMLSATLIHGSLPPPGVTLDVLDVGQGDAILVQDGNDQLLVDGGPDGAVLAALGEAMPFFDRTIETMVLTHPHADHYAGLIAVLGRYRVLRVLHSGRQGSGREFDAFLAAVREEGAELGEIGAGDSFPVGPRSQADVLWPPAPQAVRTTALPESDPNTASVMLRVSAPGGRALLTGDATPEVEAELLKTGVDLRADVLKVAHHGSRFSTTAPFLAAVAPRYAAISVGAGNRYGHPGFSLLRRLETAGVQVFRTDREGTVRIRFTDEGVVAER